MNGLRALQHLPTHCDLCHARLPWNNAGLLMVAGFVKSRCEDCQREFKAERRRRKLLRVPNCSALEVNPW